MLQLSGFIGDEEFNDSKVTTKQIIELFKLKDFDINKKHHRFKYDSSITKGRNMATGVGVQATFRGVYKGDEFFLTYYESRVHKRDDKGNRYQTLLPTHIRMNKQHKVISTQKNSSKELALFMYLHSVCKNSPVRPRGAMALWTYYDPEKAAENKYLLKQIEADINNQIMNDSIRIIKTKAYGFGLNVTGMTDNMIRLKLLETFTDPAKYTQGKVKTKEEFIAKFGQDTNTLDGLILRALADGVIRKKIIFDKWHYFWSDGEQICAIDKHASQDVDEFFLKGGYFSKEDIRGRLMQQLGETDKKKSSEGLNVFLDKLVREDRLKDNASLPQTTKDLSPERAAEYAIGLDIVVYDLTSKKVYYTKGEDYGEEIMTCSSKNTWRSEFTAKVISDADNKNKDVTNNFNKIKSKLQGKINGKNNLNAKKEPVV